MNTHPQNRIRSPLGLCRLGAIVVAVVLFAVVEAQAQLVEQAFELKTGWNAIFVEVDPNPADLDFLLEGVPVTSIWSHDETALASRSVSCDEGADSISCLQTTTTGWRVWYAPNQPERIIQSLRSLIGGKVYLIKATKPATWTIRGRPNAAISRWSKGFSIGGFHVVEDQQVSPTFAAYLAASPAHQESNIFEINSDGSLIRLKDLSSNRITPGKGYWVESSTNTVYDGPIRIDPRSLQGIDFLPGMAESFIQFENLGNDHGTISLTDTSVSGHESSSDGSQSGSLVKWYDYGGGTSPQWSSLNQVDIDIAAKGKPGAKRMIRLGVDRSSARQPVVEGPELDRSTSLLRLTDGAGFRRWIPIISRLSTSDGLWVGDVTMDNVLYLSGLDVNPSPTSSEFSFRIIIHKSGANYRLLRDVVLVYRSIDDTYLLVTPTCPQLLSADSQSPRISSANFSFDNDAVMAGDFDTQLTVSLVLDSVDPLNPFLHPFNPIHDEGFDVTRNITLVADPTGGGDPAFGITRLSGSYNELLIGLHRNQIEATGRFELRRVSGISTLCGP